MISEKALFRRGELDKGRFIVLTLSERGCEYFKCNRRDQREVFYITSAQAGCIHSIFILPPILFGMFIFEMEGGDQSRYNFFAGEFQKTQGVFCFDGRVEDIRIGSQGRLTKEEKEETNGRLMALMEKLPAHSETIRNILCDLQNQ